jgi:hypothetical protein
LLAVFAVAEATVSGRLYASNATPSTAADFTYEKPNIASPFARAASIHCFDPLPTE